MGIVIFSKNWIYWTGSFVAISHAAGTKKNYWRAFWILIGLVMIGLFLYQSVLLIIQYLQYGKNTNIQLYTTNNMPFPAVTFCNLNPFKRSEASKVPSLDLLLRAYDYINDKKMALSNSNTSSTSGTTTAASNNNNSYMSSTSGTASTPLNRDKRQAPPAPPEFDETTTVAASLTTTDWSSDCPTKTKTAQDGSTMTIHNCTDSAKIDVDCGNGSTRTISIMNTLTSTYLDLFDTMYSSCAKSLICGSANSVCKFKRKALGILKQIGNCMVNATSGYPISDPNEADPIDPITNYVTNKCKYNTGNNCNFYYQKSTETGDNFWYRICNKHPGYTTVMQVPACSKDDKDYQVKVSYSKCNNTDYIANMNTNISDAYYNYYCKDVCDYTCPFTNDDEDCGDMHYYDTLCELSTCPSTTPYESTELTTEISTTEHSTSTEVTSTTEETTTTHVTTTTEITTTTLATTTTVETTTTEYHYSYFNNNSIVNEHNDFYNFYYYYYYYCYYYYYYYYYSKHVNKNNSYFYVYHDHNYNYYNYKHYYYFFNNYNHNYYFYFFNNILNDSNHD
ncbi:unnamed protein product [Bursaphelenchus xylophilus]|uniref:(pine wood nematode) hypothetical protein n=1 Tax=Bursaphelenchus xylophilus TaxID=6326 RepID=A0A1I7SEI4_BURXY|nr:unnamed protein product [Bursaphelenchus xylophilus]CAG9113522.1 unnamed protein product [Bursaphelenchus xylophilus]